MHKSLRLRQVATVITLVVGAISAGTGSAPAASIQYVNLGDSFSSGSGILPEATGSNPACTQAQANWAHDIAQTTGYGLTDVSCGGAQTKDLAGSQLPTVPPQLDAVTASTNLVTLTLGGNDNNTYIDAFVECGTLGIASAGQGNPCQKQYGDSFDNTIRTKTYPALVNALNAIKAKAPNAQVAISGYIWVLPATTGCYPVVPIAVGDVPYLRDVQATLNDAVQRAAAATGATYIDNSATSNGHDACQPTGVRWVEPPVGTTQPVPVHPNALGEQAMANQAIAVLNLH